MSQPNLGIPKTISPTDQMGRLLPYEIFKKKKVQELCETYPDLSMQECIRRAAIEWFRLKTQKSV